MAATETILFMVIVELGYHDKTVDVPVREEGKEIVKKQWIKN